MGIPEDWPRTEKPTEQQAFSGASLAGVEGKPPQVGVTTNRARCEACGAPVYADQVHRCDWGTK